MAKLKAKIIVLENTEGQKRQYEKKCEEMAARLLEMEKKVSSARKEINHYQVGKVVRTSAELIKASVV